MTEITCEKCGKKFRPFDGETSYCLACRVRADEEEAA